MAQFVTSKFIYVQGDHTATETDLRNVAGSIEIGHGDPNVGVNEEPVSGLIPNTDYSFQFIGEYPDGSEDLGRVLLFHTTADASTTQPQDDQVATLSASPDDVNGASEIDVLGYYAGGTIHGDELEEYTILYAKLDPAVPAPTTLVGYPGVQEAPASRTGFQVFGTVAGLDPDSQYFFEVKGARTSNQQWETYGGVVASTTFSDQPGDHRVFTAPASTRTDPDDTWTLNAHFQGRSSASFRDFDSWGFVYVEGLHPGVTDLRNVPGNVAVVGPGPPPSSGLGGHLVSGLSPDTDYSFQAIGTYEGALPPREDVADVLAFHTSPDASTTQAEDDQVVNLNGRPDQGGDPQTEAALLAYYGPGTVHGDELEEFSFLFAPMNPAQPNPTTLVGYPGVQEVAAFPANPDGGTFNGNLSGLTPGTTYFYQAKGERTSNQTWETYAPTVDSFTTTPSTQINEDIETSPASPGADPSTQWNLHAVVTQEGP